MGANNSGADCRSNEYIYIYDKSEILFFLHCIVMQLDCAVCIFIVFLDISRILFQATAACLSMLSWKLCNYFF